MTDVIPYLDHVLRMPNSEHQQLRSNVRNTIDTVRSRNYSYCRYLGTYLTGQPGGFQGRACPPFHMAAVAVGVSVLPRISSLIRQKTFGSLTAFPIRLFSPMPPHLALLYGKAPPPTSYPVKLSEVSQQKPTSKPPIAGCL